MEVLKPFGLELLCFLLKYFCTKVLIQVLNLGKVFVTYIQHTKKILASDSWSLYFFTKIYGLWEEIHSKDNFGQIRSKIC